MDDLDHSVHIAERDWDFFFQESEECNLQQAALAGLDESGLSDFDESEFCLSNQDETLSPVVSAHNSIEGSHIKPYPNSEGLFGPENSLSRGEDEKCLETFVDSEDSEKLNHPKQLCLQHFSRESSHNKIKEAREPLNAHSATGGAEVHHKIARDSGNITNLTIVELGVKINPMVMTHLPTLSVAQEDKQFVEENLERALDISENNNVTSTLSSSPPSEECRQYNFPSEGKSHSVLKGSEEGVKVGKEESQAMQSSLEGLPAPVFEPQRDSQTNAEAQPDANQPAGAEPLNDCTGNPAKEKERWFVTVNDGQLHLKGKTRPSAKKKRRKKSWSKDPPEVDHGFGGLDPTTQSNSGAERFGVSEIEILTMDNTSHGFTPDCRLLVEGSCLSEFTEPTSSEITGHHELENNYNLKNHSQETLPAFHISGGLEKKGACETSQYVYDSQEQQEVTNEYNFQDNLQMFVSPLDKSVVQQNDAALESSHLPCVVVSSESVQSESIADVPCNPLNHQNLLVKLLFSSPSNNGCEMLVSCKDSDHDNIPGSYEGIPSQDNAGADSKGQSLLLHIQNDGTYHHVSGHITLPSGMSKSIESTEFSDCCCPKSIPGFISTEKSNLHDFSAVGHNEIHTEDKVMLNSKKDLLYKYTNAGNQQIVSCPSETFLSWEQQVKELPKHTGLLVSELNDDSRESSRSKDSVAEKRVLSLGKEFDRVVNDQETTMNGICVDNQEVTNSNLQQKSITCLGVAKTDDAQAKYLIPERDSILSAPGNTEPSIIVTDGSCLRMAGQQSETLKQPYLESNILYPSDPAISNENLVEVCRNDTSVMMLCDTISDDPEKNNNNHTGDGIMSLCYVMADSTESVTSAKLPEFTQPTSDTTSNVELQSEEGLAEETSVAVDTLQDNKKNVEEDESTLSQELVTCTRESENRELDQALDSTRPVYAISSFWDEMEKLTINDILHLRLVNNAHHPREYAHLQDAADVSDAADSGYFPHPYDSKPDSKRSSGDSSLFSDFEEEFLQTPNGSANPSPEPEDTKSSALRSPQPGKVWWECKPDPSYCESDNDAEDIMELSAEGTAPQLSDSPQCFRTMSRNVTVQNLQTLELDSQSCRGVPLPVIVKEEESSMFFSIGHSPEEICNLVLIEHGNNLESSPPPFLSGEASLESYMTSVPEISNYLFREDEAEPILSERASPIVSFCDRESSDLSLPETYDYFFSDFEAGNVFFPPVRRPSNHMETAIPIFSCSRSVKRKLRFIEEYDYFFPEDSPVESEDEDECTQVHVVSCYSSQICEPLDISAGPDMYEHFFTDKDWRGNLFWRHPFSLRRVQLTGVLCGLRERATFWPFSATAWRGSSIFRTMDPGNAMDNQSSTTPFPNSVYMENQLSSPLSMQQRDMDLKTAMSFPRKKGFLFTLRQSDMCLVCIAFASWVLKSTRPQSEDTWKTALLANVSAISAIRYLRKYLKEDVPRDKR